ncbi:MAG: FAD-dependent oxidoreductase [Betaproteobacteria bacterium]
MHIAFEYPRFEYRRPPEMGASDAGVHPHPLIIVGAGPVGMAAALDARAHGLPAIILDDDHTVSVGSRGLCYAKRTLEILDRLGVGEAVVNKGVTWNVGRTFFGEREVFNFNLLPEPDHHRPGMVNLQQYHLERFQVQACQAAGVDIRWQHKVVAVRPDASGATLDIETPEGLYTLRTDWLVVCDGARSPLRRMMGLDMEGQVFKDRFLIADVVMKAPFPAERWFWFDPPFHRNQSVLLHREADDVWRIDFQLGWDADPEEEKKPERVTPRIQAMLGPEVDFALEWVSVYTFQCRRMARFDHGHVLFAGDAAHQVSPFGARGANSGIQDADNLMWKLAAVIKAWSPPSLLHSYSRERGEAADENILNSTRSTDFITPKSPCSRAFRDAALQLAQHHPFARKLVNSGRLSVPTHHAHSPLSTAADAPYEGWMGPGAPMDDAPVLHAGQPTWLLQHLGGRFALLLFTDDAASQQTAQDLATLQAVAAPAPGLAPQPVVLSAAPPAAQTAQQLQAQFGAVLLHDHQGLAARRCDGTPGTALLLRPDQHIAARWRGVRALAIEQALARATGN